MKVAKHRSMPVRDHIEPFPRSIVVRAQQSQSARQEPAMINPRISTAVNSISKYVNATSELNPRNLTTFAFILRRASPVYVAIKAANEFKDKTTAINQRIC